MSMFKESSSNWYFLKSKISDDSSIIMFFIILKYPDKSNFNYVNDVNTSWSRESKITYLSYTQFYNLLFSTFFFPKPILISNPNIICCKPQL